jgi:hypothetical protein
LKTVEGWLIFEDEDALVLDAISNIEKVVKHYLPARGRSFLHWEPICTFCSQGFPKQVRYVTECLYEGRHLKWEFSDDVYRKLKPYLSKDHDVQLLVTRLGTGKATEYKIEEIDNFDHLVNVESARKIWQSVLKGLEKQVSKPNYNTWLKDTEAIGFDDGVFVVRAPNGFIAECIQDRLSSLIVNLLSSEIGASIQFKVCSLNGD